MEGQLNLTEADILTLLQRARESPVLSSDPPGARTTMDIAAELNVSEKTARRMIWDLKHRGIELEIVEVVRLNIYDQPYQVKAFRLKGGE